jgi:hypothetical protein
MAKGSILKAAVSEETDTCYLNTTEMEKFSLKEVLIDFHRK